MRDGLRTAVIEPRRRQGGLSAAYLRWPASALALAALTLAGPVAAQTPPNVLIIVTDDQRATDSFGVMPATRRLFLENGARFTNAFAATPLCAPSRSAILTGRYPHNTGVRTNGRSWRLDTATILPRLLQQASYKTALVGKFMNGWPGGRSPPHFDRSAMQLVGRGWYVDPTFNVNGSLSKLRGYSTNLLGRYATRFVRQFERSDSAPWLLYVAPVAPHFPWVPAARYARASVVRWPGNPAVFEPDRSDKPFWIRSLHYTIQDGRSVRTGQLRTLMSVDDLVGRIFSVLDQLGESRRTMAIFTSDNGFTWADHGIGGEAGTGGQKRVPYTASAAVPLLLRWPGHVPRGVMRSRLTGTMDIAPTVLDAAGLEVDTLRPRLDGRSLLAPDLRDRVLLEYWREGGTVFPAWATLRTRTFQYTEYYAQDEETRIFREYYRLRSDPWQLRNVLRDGNVANDPNLPVLAAALAQARECRGTTTSMPCP